MNTDVRICILRAVDLLAEIQKFQHLVKIANDQLCDLASRQTELQRAELLLTIYLGEVEELFDELETLLNNSRAEKSLNTP